MDQFLDLFWRLTREYKCKKLITAKSAQLSAVEMNLCIPADVCSEKAPIADNSGANFYWFLSSERKQDQLTEVMRDIVDTESSLGVSDNHDTSPDLTVWLFHSGK